MSTVNAADIGVIQEGSGDENELGAKPALTAAMNQHDKIYFIGKGNSSGNRHLIDLDLCKTSVDRETIIEHIAKSLDKTGFTQIRENVFEVKAESLVGIVNKKEFIDDSSYLEGDLFNIDKTYRTEASNFFHAAKQSTIFGGACKDPEKIIAEHPEVFSALGAPVAKDTGMINGLIDKLKGYLESFECAEGSELVPTRIEEPRIVLTNVSERFRSDRRDSGFKLF